MVTRIGQTEAVLYLQAVKLPSGSDVLNKISIDPEIQTLIVLSHSLRSVENVIWFSNMLRFICS